MSNEEKNAVIEEVLSQIMTNVISGIFPSDEVSEDDYGLWMCRCAGEVLEDIFMENENMNIEDALSISMKLSELMGYEPGKGLTKTLFPEVDPTSKDNTNVFTTNVTVGEKTI